MDRIRIPFRVVMSRKGGSTTYVFDEVKHNVPVEDARFAMPTDWSVRSTGLRAALRALL